MTGKPLNTRVTVQRGDGSAFSAMSAMGGKRTFAKLPLADDLLSHRDAQSPLWTHTKWL